MINVTPRSGCHTIRLTWLSCCINCMRSRKCISGWKHHNFPTFEGNVIKNLSKQKLLEWLPGEVTTPVNISLSITRTHIPYFPEYKSHRGISRTHTKVPAARNRAFALISAHLLCICSAHESYARLQWKTTVWRVQSGRYIYTWTPAA